MILITAINIFGVFQTLTFFLLPSIVFLYDEEHFSKYDFFLKKFYKKKFFTRKLLTLKTPI